MLKRRVCTLMILLLLPLFVAAGKDDSQKIDTDYRNVINLTANMVSSREAQSLAAKKSLQVLNVTWEDTGRYKGSSVGPNISDVTIQVQQYDPSTKLYTLTCMPVIRFPNFSDQSADIDPAKFYLLVGNEKGGKLKKITLKEYLKNLRQYMTKPGSWKGWKNSLLAKRDTHVLVSAQACFLPIPKKGIAEFNPVIFNYQSYEKNPAVLTILATREGTSMTIIDNKRDGFAAGATWGQRLFFNQKGERASLTGKRKSDFIADKKKVQSISKEPDNSAEAAGESGLNMVLMIQVPLKQKEQPRAVLSPPSSVSMAKEDNKKGISDVEDAVIGHGKVEGPFTEIDNLTIERDERFPIRVTVQFYKATSNGVVSENDIEDISSQINRVYKQADYVGSLVTAGITQRPTEYDGPKFEPPDWWENFWKRHYSNTGLTQEESLKLLRKIRGPDWTPKSEKEFEREIKDLEQKREKQK